MTEPALRATLWIIAAIQLFLGLMMFLAPGTFFDEIGQYGIRNDHYIGDVGAFYLAAAFGVGMAAARPSWRVPILYVGAVWYALHALNHLFDIGQASSDGRGAFDTISLALLAAGSWYLAAASGRLRAAAAR
ncbi:MAG TPA: hypothetical protein VFY99_02935 [Solirubrobacterales bacterium]